MQPIHTEAEQMDEQTEALAAAAPVVDVADVIEIRDPEVDVEAIMEQIRERIAVRRAQGAYREDVDALAAEIFRPAARSDTGRAGGLDTTLSELNERWMIREVPFRSRAPVVGPLIAGFRNAWNWVSTKWYVRAILQQIVSFNALVVRALSEANLEHQTLATEVRQLRALCEQQQTKIDELERAVERLQHQGSRPRP